MLCFPTGLARLKGRFFFGDLVCKWHPWIARVAAQLEEKRLARDPLVLDIIRRLPKHLLLTQQQVAQVTPATSAMHSKTHVWWCQVSLSVCTRV
jgi:hypothetical protein